MNKEFEELSKMANLVFRKYFLRYKQFKDDLIQEGIIQMWRSSTRFNKDYNVKLSTFFFVVCLNAMRLYLRKEYKNMNNVELDESICIIDKVDVMDKVIQQENFENICKEVCFLDKKIIGLYIQGFNFTEIGKCLGYSRQYITQRFNRICEDMKECLS